MRPLRGSVSCFRDPCIDGPTHSLTFALLVSGGGYLFSGSLTTAWVVFAALTSHVLRDASVGTAPLL